MKSNDLRQFEINILRNKQIEFLHALYNLKTKEKPNESDYKMLVDAIYLDVDRLHQVGNFDKKKETHIYKILNNIYDFLTYSIKDDYHYGEIAMSDYKEFLQTPFCYSLAKILYYSVHLFKKGNFHEKSMENKLLLLDIAKKRYDFILQISPIIKRYLNAYNAYIESLKNSEVIFELKDGILILTINDVPYSLLIYFEYEDEILIFNGFNSDGVLRINAKINISIKDVEKLFLQYENLVFEVSRTCNNEDRIIVYSDADIVDGELKLRVECHFFHYLIPSDYFNKVFDYKNSGEREKNHNKEILVKPELIRDLIYGKKNTDNFIQPFHEFFEDTEKGFEPLFNENFKPKERRNYIISSIFYLIRQYYPQFSISMACIITGRICAELSLIETEEEWLETDTRVTYKKHLKDTVFYVIKSQPELLTLLA